MPKQIKQFRKESYGWFIDLQDTEASVAVNPRTGEILLDEGTGEDRFDGVALAPGAFRDFRLEETGTESWSVTLEFGKNKTHVLGVTTDRDDAENWLREVTSAITRLSPKQQEPEKLDTKNRAG